MAIMVIAVIISSFYKLPHSQIAAVREWHKFHQGFQLLFYSSLFPKQASLESKVAELEASLAAEKSERITLERQRSAGKPPRAPPSPGGQSPRASPSSPFGRSGSGGQFELAGVGLQIATLEVQVIDCCFFPLPCCPQNMSIILYAASVTVPRKKVSLRTVRVSFFTNDMTTPHFRVPLLCLDLSALYVVWQGLQSKYM